MRPALALISALFLALLAAAPVSAAPPSKEPQGSDPVEFAPGEVCDFGLRQEIVATKAKTITFDRRDGAFEQNLSGLIVEKVTNLDTGASLVLQSSGPAKVFLNDVGHLVIRYGGASVLPFFDGDVTGRGLFSFVGGGAETELGDDFFFFIRVDFPPHVVDLCAALSA